MQGTKGFAVAVGLALSMALAAPALADTEPNDVISQAEGPVSGGVPITGTLGTPDDVDYYVFYAASQQQLHLSVDDLTNPTSYCLEHKLYDSEGSSLPDDYTTAPGTNRYFVALWNDDYCDGARSYRFEVDPGAAVVGGPALDRSLTQTPEPNETVGQAFGPIAANVNYAGSHDTDNDEDWFWFWVPPGSHQFDASVTTPSGSSCASEISLSSDGSDSYSSDSAYGGTGTFGHIRQTLVGPAVRYIKAGPDDDYGCIGGRWQLRIESPDAITLSDPFPPPPPPPPTVTVKKYATVVKLRRNGRRYSGRVVSVRSSCQRSRVVTLRRVGSSGSFGTAVTRRSGTFTIRRSARLRGKVYVRVTQRSSSTLLCRGGTSRRIRG